MKRGATPIPRKHFTKAGNFCRPDATLGTAIFIEFPKHELMGEKVHDYNCWSAEVRCMDCDATTGLFLSEWGPPVGKAVTAWNAKKLKFEGYLQEARALSAQADAKEGKP